jgi:hypothetical protein
VDVALVTVRAEVPANPGSARGILAPKPLEGPEK